MNINPLNLEQVSADALDKQRSYFRCMPRSCYVCTWRFNQLKQKRFKMSGYTHAEHNRLEFLTRQHTVDRYRTEQDLLNRPDEKYSYVKNNRHYRQLLRVQSERFIYMIQRSTMINVVFTDARMKLFYVSHSYMKKMNENHNKSLKKRRTRLTKEMNTIMQMGIILHHFFFFFFYFLLLVVVLVLISFLVFPADIFLPDKYARLEERSFIRDHL
jgi:hypothetical protein